MISHGQSWPTVWLRKPTPRPSACALAHRCGPTQKLNWYLSYQWLSGSSRHRHTRESSGAARYLQSCRYSRARGSHHCRRPFWLTEYRACHAPLMSWHVRLDQAGSFPGTRWLTAGECPLASCHHRAGACLPEPPCRVPPSVRAGLRSYLAARIARTKAAGV